MSFETRQTVVVLCSAEQNRDHWYGRSKLYDDIDIEALFPSDQAWRIVKDLVLMYDRPIVVCQDSIWLGAGFGDAVSAVLEELTKSVPRWGACGNRGSTWDSSCGYDYTRYARVRGGVSTGGDLRPVLILDDNLILLNCPELRNFELKDVGSVSSSIFGVPLSLECLRHSLPLFVSPHLFTLRLAQHTAQEIQAFSTDREFQEYYRSRFLNHSLPWPDGDLDLQDAVNYDYVCSPSANSSQADVVQLFDRTLKVGRRHQPSLTICCRTQFRRPELLERAIASFAIAQVESGDFLDLTVCLVSDCDTSISEPYLQAYREQFPVLKIDCWCHILRPRRYSRTDLLFAAIELATTDYIWFVDDDDYIMPGALEALSRTLQPGERVITVGNSIKVQEKWVAFEDNHYDKSALAESRIVGRFNARDIFRVFSGENFTPVCSVILPVQLVAERLKGKHALGDYNEDYFILLTALTSPKIDVRVLDFDLCGVSLRETGNTVTEGDRSNWHFSYATFMREVLAAEDRNPLLWQLGNVRREH